MSETKAPKKGKVIQLRDQMQVARGLEEYVGKSFDLSQYGGGGGSSTEIWREEISAWMEGELLKSLFFSEDWVYIVVDLIANKISSQPLVVMQKEMRDGNMVTEPDVEHPLNELLRQPNEWQDYAQFMYNWVVEDTLMGNGIVWNAPSSGQMLVLPTENLTIEFDNKGKVKNYAMSSANEGEQTAQAMQQFAVKDIVHTRRPNPNSLLWGLSPFIAGRKSILFNRYSSDYLNAFYLKQATPGLALSLDRMVNEDVALRQLKSFEQAYQGRKNTRRTLVLPKGVKATPLTHSLADQKLLDHINTNRETLLGLLKVPKHELGLQTAGSLGSEEHRIALRNFWESTLKPTMNRIAGILTKHFQMELGEDRFFQFDLSDVAALKDDLHAKAGIAKAMLEGGLSLNEVRQQVWEVDIYEDEAADTPFPLATMRSNAFHANAQASPSPAEDAEEADEAEEKGVRKIQLSAKVEDFRAHVTKQLADEEQRQIIKLAETAVELLVGMTTAAIETVIAALKSFKDIKQDDLPSDKVLTRRIMRAISEQFEESWTTDVARTLESSVDLGFDQQLDLVFNAEARQEVATLGARDAEKRRLILEARGIESFESISKTHTERIMRQITQGQKRGESITAIMRRVAKELGTPGELAGKAEMIARTETLTAVSIGQAGAVENALEVIPGLKKSWLTSGDDRVRDSHRALDGDIIDANAKFSNGLRHPRDIKSRQAEDVVNCRCTLLLVAPDDEDFLGV